jgi:hypothetical protein
MRDGHKINEFSLALGSRANENKLIIEGRKRAKKAGQWRAQQAATTSRIALAGQESQYAGARTLAYGSPIARSNSI